MEVAAKVCASVKILPLVTFITILEIKIIITITVANPE